jgi:hypothetical protein
LQFHHFIHYFRGGCDGVTGEKQAACVQGRLAAGFIAIHKKISRFFSDLLFFPAATWAWGGFFSIVSENFVHVRKNDCSFWAKQLAVSASITALGIYDFRFFAKDLLRAKKVAQVAFFACLSVNIYTRHSHLLLVTGKFSKCFFWISYYYSNCFLQQNMLSSLQNFSKEGGY